MVQAPMHNTAQPALHPGNRPPALRHSMRTHLVLLRFCSISLTTSAIDNLIFYLVFHATGTIAGAQIAARTVSTAFNYRFVRRAVFFSDKGHHALLPRYLILVGLNAAVSYAGIRLLSTVTPLGVVSSKIVTETLLFGANFTLQRAFIFTRRPSSPELPELPEL